METPVPRILLVGAYERDNFGDLLLLLQTEHYLPDNADIVTGALFATDMTALLDRKIPAYGPLLEQESFDAVWTVGGEVGGANLQQAFRMIASDEELSLWRVASESAKGRMIGARTGGTPIDSPYMPRLAAYPKNVAAAQVLNSVGFAGVSKLSAERQQVVQEISRSADRISVRDLASSAWLQQKGVAHTLAPDLVHTIARTRPAKGPRNEQLALVQISEPEIKRRGAQLVAEAIAKSVRLSSYTIKFFVAGTAPGHDSVERYQDLSRRIHEISPNQRIEISKLRRPYDLVDELSTASLWVGLSLHGRIISSAYGIPRVSFTKNKVDAYASTWDPDMPWGVNLDQLDDAIELALSPAQQSASAVGGDLAALAEKNIRSAVDEIGSSNSTDRLERRLESVESWRRWLAERSVTDQTRIQQLTRELELTIKGSGMPQPTNQSAERSAGVGSRSLKAVRKRVSSLRSR